MPQIILYSRVSTPDQAQALAQQDRLLELEGERLKTSSPAPLEILGPYRESVSAFKRDFRKRPVGRFICELLQPGDHLVFARVDRFSRNLKDFVNQVDFWKTRGIHLHFLDVNLDLNSPTGELLMGLLALFAQFFSRSLGEKMKLSYQERFVYGTAFPVGNKVLVREVKRPGLPSVTVVNRHAILFLRYVVWRRRSSYRRNGVADSWLQISDDLERARVRRGVRGREGGLPEYRPNDHRAEWRKSRIWTHLQRLMTSELPALNSERLVTHFREGLNPFRLTAKPDGHARGYKRPPRQRDSLYEHYRALRAQGKITPESPHKRPKRWAKLYDACQQCHSTDWEHRSHGMCKRCWNQRYKDRAG